MNIVLIGFMGAGKSTVAAHLSKNTGLELFECDEEIVKNSPYSSIPEIFENEGEEFFRSLEREVLSKALENDHLIISTGGGIVEREENRSLLLSSSAEVIYLDTSFETIESRIGDPSTRPLFLDREEALKRYERRLSLYKSLATWIIPTEERTAKELSDLVAEIHNLSRDASGLKLNTVIGDPVGHSMSPRLHNGWYKENGISNTFHFLARRVSEDSLESFMSLVKSSDSMNGLAVTIPHKEAVIPYLEKLSPEAEVMGAVNTVYKDSEGKLVGDNTDWRGIFDPVTTRKDIKGKKAAVIGAGGTARAATYALQKGGAEVTIINRTLERAEKLAADLSATALSMEEVENLHEYDVVIHTTSVGLGGEAKTLFSESAFREGMLVMDVIYDPKITPFLEAASSAGAEIVSGDEMFLGQAKAQYALHVSFMSLRGSVNTSKKC